MPDLLADLPPIPDHGFCIYGTVYAYPEHADALEVVYAETTRLSELEPGIIYYCLARDTENPTVFHFFERYNGRNAFEKHNQQPIIQKSMPANARYGNGTSFSGFSYTIPSLAR